jgi:hypothetical protein
VGSEDVADDAIHPMAQALGPFYSGAGIRRVLAIPDDDELSRRRDTWELLAVQTADGVWVYPDFQVDAHGRCVKPWLLEVLPLLMGVDRWSAGLWLRAPHPDLGGLDPMAAGDAGWPVTLISELARQYRYARLDEAVADPWPGAGSSHEQPDSPS